MDTKKLISCLCITYGKVSLLEEALESFLKQDYPNKEMIIINDLKEQTLIFNHPQVKIFNYKERFSTVGEKRTKSVELATGDILTGWDDDDIVLPWRLSQTMDFFNFDTKLKYFLPSKRWISTNNILNFPVHEGVTNASWTKESALKINCFAKMNTGQDVEFDGRLRRSLKKEEIKIMTFPDDKYPNIYRWGTGYYHLSGYGKDPKAADKIEKSVKDKGIQKEVILKPHWNLDWLQATRTYLVTKKEGVSCV